MEAIQPGDDVESEAPPVSALVSAMHRHVEALERQIRDRGIPIVRGEVCDHDQFVIVLDDSDLSAHHQVLDTGSISVITPGGDVYIRLGQSSTWLLFEPPGSWPFATGRSAQAQSPGLPADYDELMEAAPSDPLLRGAYIDGLHDRLPEERIKQMARIVASSEGFGALRARREQQAFVSECGDQFRLTSDEVLNEWNRYLVAKEAAQWFSSVVLPVRVQELQKRGWKTDRIAGRLRVSAGRVRVAAHVKVTQASARLVPPLPDED